jgi:ribonuclease E
MDEMMKSIEKLDAKIQASTGEEEATAPTPAEESMPASAQDTPHGNGTEPAAAPAKARRNAKRPLEAKPASGTETTGGEAPKAAPRKRAAKAAPLEAQAVAGKATQAAPRKKAEKAEPAAVEPSEGKAPKAAPRKRTAKKTPVPETTEQDSTSAQA